MKKNNKERLSREAVYELITDEALFAEQFNVGVSRPPDQLADHDKSLMDWLGLMESYLQRAKQKAGCGFDQKGAKEDLRIALSLGVNALRYHGCEPRQHFTVSKSFLEKGL